MITPEIMDLFAKLAREGLNVSLSVDGTITHIAREPAKGNAARCARYRMSKHVETMSKHVSDMPSPSLSSPPSPLSPSPPIPTPTPTLPPTHARERELLIERIAAAYPRKDATFIVLQNIADRLESGQDGELMLRKVQACAFLIASAEGGSGNRFVPTAKKFFEDDQWKSPEAFKRFEDKPAPKPVRGTPETGVYKVKY